MPRDYSTNNEFTATITQSQDQRRAGFTETMTKKRKNRAFYADTRK